MFTRRCSGPATLVLISDIDQHAICGSSLAATRPADTREAFESAGRTAGENGARNQRNTSRAIKARVMITTGIVSAAVGVRTRSFPWAKERRRCVMELGRGGGLDTSE